MFNFLERVPSELAAVEDGGMFGLCQVKQVGWLEHEGKLGEIGTTANLYFAGTRSIGRCSHGWFSADVLRLPFAAAGVFSPMSARPRSSNG